MPVWAFDFRSLEQNRSSGRALSATAKEDIRPMGWDVEEEIQSWRESLEWWVGKCGFCAGKGLYGAHIEHILENCPRGGSVHIGSGLGECILLEGIVARGGCRSCGIPRDRWQRTHTGGWESSTNQCQYQNLVYHTMIGLFHCGDNRYRMDAYNTIEEEGLETYGGLSDEDVACWLSAKLTVASIRSSQIMRVFTIWTRMAWRAKLS